MSFARPVAAGCHDLPPPEMIQSKVTRLPPDHIVRLLYAEHDRILAMLSDLEDLVRVVSQAVHASRYQIDAIGTIACMLIEAEPHHKREEEVLFPELENRGIYGPPHVMRAEHTGLRKLKNELLELAMTGIPGAELQRNIRLVAGSLIDILRLHIRKENEILYPLALTLIDEPEVWNRLNAASAAIGPCHF